MKRALLINWDSYPHVATGGVYTWARGLVENMREWEFVIFNQLSNPNANSDFTVPHNVRKVIGLPVFGTHRVEEYYAGAGPLRTKLDRTTEDVLARRFMPAYAKFIEEILADECQPENLARAIYDLHNILIFYDSKKLFENPRTWQAFLSHVQNDPLYREMKLRDALINFQVVQRCMQLLAVRIPRVNLIHTSLAWLPALVGISSKIEQDCPFVVTEHGVAFRELVLYYNTFLYNESSKLFWTTFTKNLVTTVYNSADLIVPVCRANQVWETRLGADKKKIRVIHNGVDTRRFCVVDSPERGRPTVVSLARISVFKDIVGLIQAIDYARAEVPDINCLVFGEATEREYSAMCADIVRELKLEPNFRFMGGTNHPERAYGQADVVACSSITEGFPFAVIEAMACGKPVVATDVGGVSEAIEGCGILVKSRNPRALSEGIVKLLKDEPLRREMGVVARARAVKEFSLETSISQYQSVYNELTSPASGHGIPEVVVA